MIIGGDKEIIPEIERLIALIRNKKIVLWAGSGLSLYAGYPSGQAFCDIIYNAAKTEEDKKVLFQHKSTLMNIAEEYEQLYSRDELINLVSEHFDKAPSVSTYTHFLCTQIPQISTIITTNYDHLFEIAYQGRINTVIGTQFSASDKEPVTLYKIHGDSSSSASVVLTSKDYAQFYTKLDSLVWNKLKTILAEHSVLFIGYSLEDKNIEDIFEKVLSQIDTTKSEFFIAVPSLADHKLKHFNSICNTTHIPIDGETLLKFIEKAIRENIVFDAIDKKISIDQAQSVAYDHGIQPIWRSTPSGRSTELGIDGYILNPFGAFKYNGATIHSSNGTYQQMEQFMDDCDCRELVLPAADVNLFENVNGINIPKSNLINRERPNVVKIEKPEQVHKATLTISNKNINVDSIILRSFWGNKRKRVVVELLNINVSLLYNSSNNSVNVTLSFVDRHTSNGALNDLSILSLWHDGATLTFSRRIGDQMKPILLIPPVKDEEQLAVLSQFIQENSHIYRQIVKLEQYLKKDFIIPANLTIDDRDAIIKILSVFEPQEVGNIYNLNLQLTCDSELYKVLKVPITGSIEMIEQNQETICLFGNKYIISETRYSIISPFIEDADEVESMILSGIKPIVNVKSSIKSIIMRCKF